jgi:hypothetical protein
MKREVSNSEYLDIQLKIAHYKRCLFLGRGDQKFCKKQLEFYTNELKLVTNKSK